MNKTPKKALLAGLLMLGICCVVAPSKAQDAPISDGFKRRPSGLEYKIITHGQGTRKPQMNDHVEINIHIHDGDSILFDSRKMNNNKCVPLPISAPKFKGDVMEGFMLMVAGDSAIFRLPVDSFRKSGTQLPPWAKDGERIEYDVVLVSVKTDAEEKKDQAEKAEKQKAIDEKLLKEYFTGQKIKATKTQSGLYYKINTPGSGDNVKAGATASVNYTGMFMDGKKFDSNTDSAFHHVQAFTLEVGVGKVIKGWDEGLQLLKKGSKATFYIPSTLAYGSMERPGIPSNSILIFDVEITDIQTPVDPAMQKETDDKLIQAYLAKHEMKATKTPSGLYYVITTKGLGPNAKPGRKVTMNYTGKTLDGNVFDSNTDPAKGHVQPFSFTLGQGQVIKGWDEGVQLMNLGTKATIILPSSLGYGASGAGNAIPPNAVLLFDVEVTGIDK